MSNIAEEKEIVWLPKELAEKVKGLDSKHAIDELVLSYIAEVKRDMHANIESMDEDLLMFKGMMARVRTDFKAAKDEHLKASYDIWENYASDIKELCHYVDTATKTLTPLKEELNSLKELMSGLQDYRVKDLCEMLTTFQKNLSGQNGDMLRFLMDNFDANKKD